MPDNWIGRIRLTDESDVVINGEKHHDLLELLPYGDTPVPVDAEKYPLLAAVLPESETKIFKYGEGVYALDVPVPPGGDYYCGLAWDGNNYWFGDDDPYEGDWYTYFKLDADFKYTGEYFQLGGTTGGATDVTCKGVDFFIASENESKVFKVDSTGSILAASPELWDYEIGGCSSIAYDKDRDCLWVGYTYSSTSLYQLDIDTLIPTGISVNVGTYYMGKLTYLNNSIFGYQVDLIGDYKVFEYDLLKDERNTHYPETYMYDNAMMFGMVSNDVTMYLFDSISNEMYEVGHVYNPKELPTITPPPGSDLKYKIIADAYIAPIYRWQDLWTINAPNSGWGTEGYADFTETGIPAMSTIDPDGISDSMGKRVEMDIIVDSADFTDDYSWLQIYPNTPLSDHLSENWFFRGDQAANNNGFSATGTLLDDGRYLFTVNFDNALYDGVLDGNLINLKTHQNMNYFDFSIAEIRVMEVV